MSIWFDKTLSLEKLQPFGHDTMSDWLGIEWVEIGEDYLKARMPVDHRTVQTYRILHGGASCVLAETVGSIGCAMVIDHTKYFCVGLDINANHIRSARQGYVTGIAKPIHIGGSTHVWEIRIVDEEEKLICISRLTMAILERKVK
ncbi:MAG TPA: hotdog fold thioesterase [Chitinophagaceae bacterium]|nr:hotdog fold thioesterase [Chitinophagaceae bacterium]